MTQEEYKKKIFNEHSSTKVYKSAKKYIKSLEAELKESNDEINRLNIENKQLIEHITSGALLKPLVFCHSCKKEIK